MPETWQRLNIKSQQMALRRYITMEFPAWRWKTYFDCEPEYMRAFIEHQFVDDMSWANWGEVWQVDHILPVCVFDQDDCNDLEMCWNYINLRPLKNNLNKARNPLEATLKIFEHRKRYFPDNQVVERLIEKTKGLLGEEPKLVDWNNF